MKMKGVQETEEKEINDEFAKEVGEFENLEELKNNVREGLEQEKQQNEKQRRRVKILEKVVAKTDVKVPGVMVEREKNGQLERLKQRANQELGVSFDEYLEKVDKDERELEKTLVKEAEKRAKRFLVLQEVAKEEDIGVSEAEIEEEVSRVLARFSSVEQAKNKVDLNRLKSYTEDSIRNEKVLKTLEEF